VIPNPPVGWIQAHTPSPISCSFPGTWRTYRR
jgi:hypothetical protein